MHKEVSRAHAETLAEWAILYKRSGVSGSEEIAYLLQRAARLIVTGAEVKGVDLPPEPAPKEPEIVEPKAG